MARTLARLGDKSSYGGIISATATWFEGHKAIARTGDKSLCSKCDGDFELLTSAQDWAEEGRAYVATGDRVLCHCPDHYVFCSGAQHIRTMAGTLTSRNTGHTFLPARQAQDPSARHTIRFQCAGGNGQLMTGCCYTLMFPDGDALRRVLPMSAGLRDGIMPNQQTILACIVSRTEEKCMSANRWSGVHGKNSGLDGDKTSTGAVCYAGSQGWSVNGRRKLYVGDKTSPCPKCVQPGEIASGDLRQTNPQGLAVAVDGSPVRCGCAAGINYVIAAGNPSTADFVNAQSRLAQQSSSLNTIRFQCADDDGRLMIACRYVLMFPDGHTETGSTDNQGMTEWHFAEFAENINLHIVMD